MADGLDLTFVFHICFIELIFSILDIKLHISIFIYGSPSNNNKNNDNADDSDGDDDNK